MHAGATGQPVTDLNDHATTKCEYHSSPTRTGVHARRAKYSMVERLLGDRSTKDGKICNVCAMVVHADDVALQTQKLALSMQNELEH